MPKASAIPTGWHSAGIPIALQPALRIFGYHWLARGWTSGSRGNPEEPKMSSIESSTSGVADANQKHNVAPPARKRRRPLTAGQEALFFGVTFAIAVAFQIVVVLKVADVIAW